MSRSSLVLTPMIAGGIRLQRILTLLAKFAYAYFACLFGWAIVHAFFGDRWWWLSLLNSLAVYLFLPLPGVLAIALLVRRRELWVVSGAALVLGASLYGGLFLPRFPQAHASNRTLTIMSYNILGFNEHTGAIVTAIRTAGADVVALQELNPPVAEAIQLELSDEYPYQVLNPLSGITGLGVISRYPLQPTGQALPGTWLGQPQVLALRFDGTQVILINLHNVSVNFDGWNSRTSIEGSVQQRERQAQVLVDFVAAQPGPLIALGDFNISDQSTAYRLVTDVLSDAWREAGYGLGHTFPGTASPGSARPIIAGLAVPMWLVRIDYVFHSDQWQASSAWIGPWDGVSDHRPVVARLILVDR